MMTRRGGWPALWAVVALLVGLAATVAAVAALQRSLDAAARADLNRRVEQVKDALNKRLQNQETVLVAARGLLTAGRLVTREEFSQFVAALDLRAHHPSVNLLGVIRRVPAADLSTYQEGLREQGVRAEIRYLGPPRSADGFDHYLVDYAEPLDRRPLVGLEVSTEVNRWAAMQRTARSGGAVLSAPLVSALEPGAAPLMGHFMPLYRTGAVPSLAAERERMLWGFVVLAFSVPALVDEAFADLPRDVDIRLTDLAAPDADGQGRLLHHRQWPGTDAEVEAQAASARWQQRTSFFWGNRFVQLDVRGNAAFEAAHTPPTPIYLALLGAGVSLALAWGVWALAQGRGRALRRLAHLSEDLERLSLVAKNTQSSVAIRDAQGRITWVNDAHTRLTGLSPAQAAGRSFASELETAPPSHPRGPAELAGCAATGQARPAGAAFCRCAGPLVLAGCRAGARVQPRR